MSNETSRDENIERYLDGEMSVSERQQFEAEVASSDRLRRSLRIEQAIATGIAIERSTLPPRHAEMRARAIDAIGRIAPAPPPAPPAGSSSPDNGPSRRSAGFWITGGLVALALGFGGGMLLQPDGNEAREPAVRTAAPAAKAAPAPAATAPAAVPSTVGTDELESSTARETSVQMDGRRSEDGVKSRSGRGTPSETRAATSSGAERTAETTAEPAKPKSKPTVFKDPIAKSPLEDESSKK